MDLIDHARFDELHQALGKDQTKMLVELLPASYEEERARLLEAISSKDIEALRRAAHAIKGMAGNMAAQKLAEDARTLEIFDGAFDDALDDQINRLDRLVSETVSAMQAALT